MTPSVTSTRQKVKEIPSWLEPDPSESDILVASREYDGFMRIDTNIATKIP